LQRDSDTAHDDEIDTRLSEQNQQLFERGFHRFEGETTYHHGASVHCAEAFPAAEEAAP